MADLDSESSFHEIYGDVKKNFSDSEENTGSTVNKGKTGNTSSTGRMQYPFSVRLDQEYVDIIKGLAWWKRISQREFIEEAVSQYLDNIDSEELKDILNQYHENN